VPARPALREGSLTGFAGTSSPDTAGPPPRPDQGDARPPEREPGTGFRPPAVSFWDALDPAEREALAAVAVSQMFAAAEVLMREGDLADHVMVIIEGHAEVCVDEKGWERVLAERGPGELVGERGGLQLRRIRSASVIALDAMRVLTVQTGDFHAFVNGHPKVFDIVEQQLYDRLTEAPAGHQDGFRLRDPSVTPALPGRGSSAPFTARSREARYRRCPR